jgi:multiple sugar transport system ATP-binding protein
LYDRPANVFVAGFIGSPAMNFLPGRAVGGACRVGDVSLPLPAGRGQEGLEIVYGIRPEHWRLDASGVEATIRLVEPTGSETQVVAELAGQTITGAFRERVTQRPGEIIRISPDLDHVHLFDRMSGLRMKSGASA